MHIKWTDTEQIHHLRKRFNLLQNRDKTGEYRPPVVTYRSKVKLHGTNAGIQIKPNGEIFAQSRTSIITPDSDNAGFAAWVFKTRAYWGSLANSQETQVVYGEWCGPGIQKGTAINQIPEKSLCVFSIQFGEVLYTEPEQIQRVLCATNKIQPNNVYVLPWEPGCIAINFGLTEGLKVSVDRINQMVQEVEACDPWVKQQFGIEGIGEGLVFYPTNQHPAHAQTREEVTEFLFKAKGEKHQVVAQKAPAQIDPEAAASAQQFVELVATDVRLEQGLAEGAGGDANMKMIGPFLKWVNQDIKKECQAELEASGLDWKAVGKPLTTHIRQWFIEKVNSI